MKHHEKVFFALCAVFIVAVLIWKYEVKSPFVAMIAPSPPQNTSYNKFSYLTYNQPYYFSPPVANTLPQTAKGILGIKYATDTSSFDGTSDGSDCGC